MEDVSDEEMRFAETIFSAGLPAEERALALKAFIQSCVEGGYDEESGPKEKGGVALLLGEPEE